MTFLTNVLTGIIAIVVIRYCIISVIVLLDEVKEWKLDEKKKLNVSVISTGMVALFVLVIVLCTLLVRWYKVNI